MTERLPEAEYASMHDKIAAALAANLRAVRNDPRNASVPRPPAPAVAGGAGGGDGGNDPPNDRRRHKGRGGVRLREQRERMALPLDEQQRRLDASYDA